MPEMLGYAPRTRWTFVRKHRRRIIAMIVCMIVAGVSYRHRTGIYEYFAWRYYFWQCMRHEMPADVELIRRSATQPVSFRLADDYVASTYDKRMFYSPRAFQELSKIDRRTDWLCTVWDPSQVTFMGKMKRPDGQDRLVVISGASTNALDFMVNIRALVLPKPAIFDAVPKESWSRISFGGGRWEFMSLQVGQIDPANNNHLVLPFKIADCYSSESQGLVDAYLQNDDSIRFVLRGEAKQGNGVTISPTTRTLDGRADEQWLARRKQLGLFR